MKREDIDISKETGLKAFKEAEKIPVNILFNKEGGYLEFNAIFNGLDIIVAHLLKSDEYIYGIYEGAKIKGFMYFGEKLTMDQQKECYSSYLPIDYNGLEQIAQTYYTKIDYYVSNNNAFKIVGEINEKEIIIKNKQDVQIKKRSL